jgi:hypothetical protein
VAVTPVFTQWEVPLPYDTSGRIALVLTNRKLFEGQRILYGLLADDYHGSFHSIREEVFIELTVLFFSLGHFICIVVSRISLGSMHPAYCHFSLWIYVSF